MESTPPLVSSRDVLSVILGGGAGTRLFPLTLDRSKPAVPLAGKYRLVDIPISLCITSGFRRIFLLTQFNSSSLHRYIQQAYRFDQYTHGFVELMAAQQTPKGAAWYQGTADAVRQNLQHFDNHPHELVLILSGDQLYRMDFRKLVAQHLQSGADVTVATIPVGPAEATGFGLIEIDGEKKIRRFVEKPKDPAVLKTLELGPQFLEQIGASADEPRYLASMGIYIFNRHVLKQALEGTKPDFGKDILPSLLQTHKVHAYLYNGYWEDIGTIKAFFEANLDLCEEMPKFDFFDASSPIYSHNSPLPGSKVTRSQMEKVVLADGCIVMDAHLERVVAGIRSRIHSGATVKNAILMGQDFYESDAQVRAAEAQGLPRLGIGHNTYVDRAIIDKNVRIGNDVRISPEGKPDNHDGPNYFIRDGIVVIPKGAVIPHGTVI
ncbi:MAG: glucose-1-phosphate adenylyltransferase [Verrucomicrobium sp.]|nr:glucose-1-phosphate adenylyltransferase [Verrucomicrobium sp.]